MKSIILKQHDILALKEGRKTQHRVVLKHNIRNPYKAGDLMFVKEDYATLKDGGRLIAFYKADADSDELKSIGYSQVKPSKFMPRWASRFTLKITGVRVERLQDISEEDAIAEGVESWLDSLPNDFRKSRGILCDNYHTIQYRQLWKSINGKDSWEANPWVWVLDFIVHNKNIDEVINGK